MKLKNLLERFRPPKDSEEEELRRELELAEKELSMLENSTNAQMRVHIAKANLDQYLTNKKNN